MDPMLQQRLDAIKQLVALFRFEKAVYLAISTLSALMLLGAAAVLLLRKDYDVPVLAALFGSSGLIAYSLGRLLRMWDQAITAVLGAQDAPP